MRDRISEKFDRPRLLIVAPESPWPPRNGAALRISKLAEGLAEEWNVRLVCYGRVPSESVVQLPGSRIVSITVPCLESKRERFLSALSLFMSGRPYQYCFFDTQQMRRTIRREAMHADLLIVELLTMAGVALASQIPSTLPLILDMHNAEADRAVSICKRFQSSLQRTKMLIHLQYLRRFEPWAVSQFDACVFVSQSDREAVLKAAGNPPLPTYVIPNGANPSSSSTSPRKVEKHANEFVLTFVGSLDYVPNIDGACWFARRILPIVRQAVPETKVRLVGRNPTKDVLSLRSLPGLEVFADVPDVADFLESSDTIIVPLRAGGGTKLKTLEALASGKPLVSTSVGIEGLDLVPGRDLLVADDETAFAQMIIELSKNTELRTSLAAHGLRVATLYDWRRICRTFNGLVRNMLSGAQFSVYHKM